LAVAAIIVFFRGTVKADLGKLRSYWGSYLGTCSWELAVRELAVARAQAAALTMERGMYLSNCPGKLIWWRVAWAGGEWFDLVDITTSHQPVPTGQPAHFPFTLTHLAFNPVGCLSFPFRQTWLSPPAAS
jgi:hypothetical protein